MRPILKVLAVQAIIFIVGAEIMLNLFFNLPDPYAGKNVYNRFLTAWNLYGIPPLAGTFFGGNLIGVPNKKAKFSFNRIGFLYDEQKAHRTDKNELRIGVVGGSTVECIVLEEVNRWPSRLQAILSESIPGRSVTVLNLGLSDQDTRTHLANVAEHAVKLDLDYLVFMLGANDLFRTRKKFQPLLDDKAVTYIPLYSGFSSSLKWAVTRTQLGRAAKLLVGYFWNISHSNDPFFWREVLAVTTKPVDPDARLDISKEALADYESNLISLNGLALAHGITPIFTTQPMLWKPEMTTAEQHVDWMRAIVEKDGKKFRISSAEAARNLELLNRQLMDSCREHDWKCIDVANKVPRSLTYFYDSLHFNDAGADLVASNVAKYMLPFLAETAGSEKKM